GDRAAVRPGLLPAIPVNDRKIFPLRRVRPAPVEAQLKVAELAFRPEILRLAVMFERASDRAPMRRSAAFPGRVSPGQRRRKVVFHAPNTFRSTGHFTPLFQVKLAASEQLGKPGRRALRLGGARI